MRSDNKPIEIKYSFYLLNQNEVAKLKEAFPKNQQIETYGLNRYDEYFLPPLLLISLPYKPEEFIQFTKTNQYYELINRLIRIVSNTPSKVAVGFSLNHDDTNITISCVTNNVETLKNFLTHIHEGLQKALNKIEKNGADKRYIKIQHSDLTGRFEKVILI